MSSGIAPQVDSPARPIRFLLVLVVVAVVYWLWLGLEHRSVTTDPGISILAARGILEHGYPLLPSGLVYYKGVLPSYLVAGTAAVIGLNDFAILLPSLLMSVGSLLLVYRLAERVVGRPWVGLATAVILIATQTHSYYAVSPRMYMSLQFFTLLVAYGAWRGHVEGSGLFKVITVLGVVGAILSHHQGGVLVVAVPITVLGVQWLARKQRPTFELLPLSGMLAVGGAYIYLFLLDNLPQPHGPEALEAPILEGSLRGVDLDPAVWASHINWLEHTVPFGLLLAPVVAVFTVRAVRQAWFDGQCGPLYLILLFGVWVLGVLGYILISGTRFWIGIAPIYVLVLLLSLDVLRRDFAQGLTDRPAGRRRRIAWVAVLLGWSAAVVGLATRHYGPMGYPTLIRDGYGIPCLDPDDDCYAGVKDLFAQLQPTVGPDDLIISTRPLTTSYYLGRVDGWLAQKERGSDYTPFETSTDAYFAVPLIDTHEEILELSRSERRVIVITDRALKDLNADTKALIPQLFQKIDESGPLIVYASSTHS